LTPRAWTTRRSGGAKVTGRPTGCLVRPQKLPHPLVFNELARAASVVAQIHHSHGIKAAVALSRLADQFPNWSEDFWLAALRRAEWQREPRVSTPVVTPRLRMTRRSAVVLLSRSVIPASYGAVREWAKLAGVEGIILHYADEACFDPGYLGHRLSVLLGFLEGWSLYRNGPYEPLFLDRLTEFLLAAKFLSVFDGAPRDPQPMDLAIRLAVRRPGFFGHHVICLAWLLRHRSSLSPTQVSNALGWVVAASSTDYPDAADNVRIEPCDDKPTTLGSLEECLRDLLIRGTPNIHLLTLADALASLWPNVDEHTQRHVLAIASHFAHDPTAEPGAEHGRPRGRPRYPNAT